MFVSERRGRVLELLPNGSRRVAHEFVVDATGEAGLLGLAVSASFPADGWLYAYFTSLVDNRVVRFRPGGTVEPILTGIPKAAFHDGGIIAFAPDGTLFVGTGDASVGNRAQDLGSLGGKILRLHPDGAIPADNPFPGSPVWSYGHRNVQGLAWNAAGQMYANDLGPDADDEINLIRPGGNYGWPVVTGEAGRNEFIDPIFVRQPEEASWSQLALLQGSSLPQWEGDLFAAALRGQRLWRVRVGADARV
ncbi:MAG: PQQ-dependent sugar dehydrogenase, partial [Actinomycetota bacterium]|nr:PQQ-dependent sugar dehydrogenase [Actinomycetota bacterium]